MNKSIFQWRSLKTRVTLFTLAIFVISIWALAFYASRMLREDIQRLLGEQQFSTVSLTADETNHELHDWLETLKTVGGNLTPAMLDNSAVLQAFLEQYPTIQNSFNGGVIAYRLDGTAVAEVPLSGRVGVNFMDRDFVAAALKEGKSTIGKPHRSKRLGNPEFGMAVPIRDSKGQVIGALGGEINLAKPNVLDAITQGHYGKTGGYVMVAPQYRLVVTATDRNRVMEALPAPGIVPSLDRFIQGYQGSAVYVNSHGVEVLASVKGIPVAGWYMAAALPTAEAFAPIHAMQQRMLLAASVLTLLAGVLTWWILKRELAPMLAAAQTLATLSDSDHPPQPLPITRQDEIGDLIGGFNRLLETLGHRERSLKTREERFQLLFDRASDGILIMSLSGQVIAVNESFARMHGYTTQEMQAMNLNHLDSTPDTLKQSAERMQRILAGESITFEVEHYHQDGHVFPLEVSASLILSDGEPLIQAFHRDITERRRAATDLRALSAQLTMTEERERQLLAQELHDNLGQLLAVIKIKLTSLAAGALQPAVNQIVELVDQADQSARMITRELSPPILRTLGLASALEWLAEEMSRMYGLTVHVGNERCTRPLIEGVQAVLYRSARELLINVAKHAGVSEANLDFICDDSQLILVVSDDGCGFDAPGFRNASPGQRSFGLSSIRERITNIGGDMDIDSHPDQGTTITLTLPCVIAMKECTPS